MKHTRINDLITYVEPGSMAGFSACSGMIIQSKRKVLVDMNMGRKQVPQMLAKEAPDACIITHFHLDHSVWTRAAADTTEAKIFIPACEAQCLSSLETVIEKTALPFGEDRAAKWRDFAVNTLGYAPLPRYCGYDDASSFSDLVPEMVVIATPGHSPGHSSFYFPDYKILFSGDMGLDRFGPWYGWTECNILNIVESIMRLDGMDIQLILTTHGGIIDKNIHGAWQKSLAMMLERERQVRDHLDAGLGLNQAMEKGVFYKNKNRLAQPMRTFLDMWDEAMFQHHETLLNQGGLLSFFPELSAF